MTVWGKFHGNLQFITTETRVTHNHKNQVYDWIRKTKESPVSENIILCNPLCIHLFGKWCWSQTSDLHLYRSKIPTCWSLDNSASFFLFRNQLLFIDHYVTPYITHTKVNLNYSFNGIQVTETEPAATCPASWSRRSWIMQVWCESLQKQGAGV